ncbi:hypothetical protein HHK36_021449 [Tetracentron sinense]|uniref:Uncharacterized protein n=1 Tax=Tetracentron sinense TaxID=13715 RepID=A0A835D7D6_TETSI|nr:hypothetical protein HHK36_021449 [Tetracentron sinense]
MQIVISRSTEGGGPSETADGSKCISEIDEHAEEKLCNSSDGSRLSEIEQLDELNRLTEILQSRVVDLSNVDEQGKKNPSMTAGAEAAGAVLALGNLRTTVEEKQADLNTVIGETSNPHFRSTIRDEIGASPVEIAKAYMGSRTSELGISSQSISLKDRRAPLHSDDFASKPYIPTPSPKSSICWPGAMVQDQHGYLTPQTQRGRIGLHNLPQTPYSRTVNSRSSPKLQGGGDRSINISSTHWKRPQTPIYGDRQVKPMSDISDDGYGSVGPIRRIRQKVVSTTPSREAGPSHPTKYGPWLTENTDTPKSFFPAVKKNLEPGASSSTPKFQPVDSKAPNFNGGVSTVHPQSTEIARKILEHLDRTVPTPKEKSAEIKLATAWKKPPSSEFNTSMPNGQFSIPRSGGIDFHKSSELVGRNFSVQRNEERGSSFLKVQPEQRKSIGVTDAVNKSTLVSHTVFGIAGFGCDGTGAKTGPSLDFKKIDHSQTNTHEVSAGLGDSGRTEMNQLLPLHNQIDGQDVSKVVSNASGNEILNLQKKHPTHSSGNRPALTSISIGKPGRKHAVSFDNGSGFTFPVSASSGVLSEPPTPSIMPSFSASGLPQQKEGSSVPSYTFGSKKSSPTLVFTFPSTSTSTFDDARDDASTIKFNFGSDKKTREIMQLEQAIECKITGITVGRFGSASWFCHCSELRGNRVNTHLPMVGPARLIPPRIHRP